MWRPIFNFRLGCIAHVVNRYTWQVHYFTIPFVSSLNSQGSCLKLRHLVSVKPGTPQYYPSANVQTRYHELASFFPTSCLMGRRVSHSRLSLCFTIATNMTYPICTRCRPDNHSAPTVPGTSPSEGLHPVGGVIPTRYICFV